MMIGNFSASNMPRQAKRHAWLPRGILSATTGVALVLGLAGAAHAAACNTTYATGDVFASVGNSTVDVFTPTGTLVCTLNDLSGSFYTTGSGFDSSGNFYVTNFSTASISQFNNSGTLLSTTYMSTNNGTTTFMSSPESIVNVATGPYAGSSFVGGPTDPQILQFNTATGALQNVFNVAGGNGTGGTDWLDFIGPTTAIYDGEGTAVKSYDFSTTTQNADFASDPNYGYAMRVIPSGAFAGDVLRADSTQATLLSSSGAVLTNYTLPGNAGGDFALNLDPNGTDFWTADPNSQNIWEVNIATGVIDEQFNCATASGSSCGLFGLAVYGEITTVSPPPTGVPEPGSLALVASSLVGLWAVRRRRQAS
jgi:hypothetical protein